MGNLAWSRTDIKSICLAFFVATIWPDAVSAASFDGALSLNRENLFGTIALVPKAIRKGQFSSINKYNVIPHESEVKLSGQTAYCFIATHFDPENSSKILAYKFSTTVMEGDQLLVVDPGTRKTLPITNNNASTKFPSYCMYARAAGTKMNVSVQIKTSEREIDRSFTIVFQ
ncbi:hypothetical protein [Roseibium sediminicola]|uniref:Uncharacterized protein n=1 Tax=Roseibium sediminicola TaxID=2933272 RepID=A0ABT0GP12_9HYPH|nr:hypothetical protein [Roseibium sp. CAU 1639]MCK7611066.1 hypothetical protein [Roseibium sp. CAU 1639]